MPQQQPQNPTQTIPITNFGGRLTRKLNGDLNSGFAKYTTSFGYDPFSKPENLTWLEQPVDITGPTSHGLVLAAVSRTNGNNQRIFAVTAGPGDTTASVVTIQPTSIAAGSPNIDSVIGIASLVAGGPTFLYGASIKLFGVTERVYVSSDNSISALGLDGSGVIVGPESNFGATNMAANEFHPLQDFAGGLMFGNGNTVAKLSVSSVITSSIIGTGQGALFSELNPPLDVRSHVRDLDLSTDGNYLLITATNAVNEQIQTFGNDFNAAIAQGSNISYWNGADQTITAENSIPSFATSALQTYLQNNYFFGNDAFGSLLNDGNNKRVSLPKNKAPLPNATAVNGNFLTWACPEVSPDNTTRYASLYYYGQLDDENPPGLWRVMRLTPPDSGGFVYQVPVNIFVNNNYQTVNSASSGIAQQSYGKHYFSVLERKSDASFRNLLYYFLITPSGSGTPQLGVYETQTQLFSKKINVKQIRVYTEPTVANNGFQIDCIGSDGNVISNSMPNTYTFAAGTNPQALQGALERIDFNPVMKDTFALGLRVTNTGTTNMTIKKIEVDWQYSGK